MTQKNAHILIFGAGSVGCYIGGRLIQAGLHQGVNEPMRAHVTLLGRPALGDRLTQRGMSLTHHSRDDVHIPPEHIHHVNDLANCPKPDVIFICVKSQDTAMAAAQIKAAGWRAPLISWQNGIGNVAALKAALPGNEIIPAMVPFNITRPQKTQFHCGTGGALHMGLSGHPAVKQAQILLGRVQETVIAVDDIEPYQWGKLIINLNNALNTLTGEPLRGGFMNRDYRRALAASWEEALSRVRAAGIEPKFFNGMTPEKFIRLLRLPTWLFAPIFSRLIKMDKTARSSMLDDLEAGRKSEIDYLQGAVISLAEANRKTAPVNTALYRAVKTAFETGESPKMTGRQIWDQLRGL